MSLAFNMDLNLIIFISPRYWTDEAERNKAIAGVTKEITRQFAADLKDSARVNTLVIRHESDLSALSAISDTRFALFVPLSGAVQPLALKAAQNFSNLVIWASYVKGQLDEPMSQNILGKNAAPAVMDLFAVIKRNQQNLKLAYRPDQILKYFRAVQAVARVKNSKLLLIGDTEPWVISGSRDKKRFSDKLNIDVIQTDLEELYQLYHKVSEDESAALSIEWQSCADGINEPTKADIANAAQLIIAIKKLIDHYHADGIAIACFKLLHDIHTTSCLAVSHVNDDKVKVAACEGDLDSAVTLLLIKALTGKSGWMANPNIQADGSINFAHCTAPLLTGGEKKSHYTLRSHHESGIGVSPEVNMDYNQDVTVLRVGNELSRIAILKGKALNPVQENTCRTKLRVQFESIEHFLEQSLGCHSIIVYGDYVEELKLCADILGLAY